MIVPAFDGDGGGLRLTRKRAGFWLSDRRPAAIDPAQGMNISIY
jgi:hypothetical protein